MKDENMLTAQALREIEERVIRWRAAITDGDDTNLVFAPWNFKALQDLLADRKALAEVLRWAIREIDRNTCEHERISRGGTIWTICEDCGKKWADNEGGFVPYKENPMLAKARSALQEDR